MRIEFKEKDEVEFLINELDYITLIIQNMDAVIKTIDDIDVQEKYNKDLLEEIKKYKQICFDLVKKFESYFVEEKKRNLPANFNYFKLYKQLSNVIQNH